MFSRQQSDEPAEQRAGNLYQPSTEEGQERGQYQGMVRHSSLYTQAALSPGRALLAAGVGLVVFAGLRRLTNSEDD
jgi:hypothetical protein